MGFCGEMVMRRTPEKGTGGSGEGRGERTGGRLGEALRYDAYIGFREGQLTVVNNSRS